jgi:hypothetical protein
MIEKKDQLYLAIKFAKDWHLDVQDRQTLSNGFLNGKLVCEEIIKILEEENWYPASWRPDMDFDGGLIEKLDNSRCQIHWKAETGVLRYALIEVQEFDSIDKCVMSFGKRFFGNEFDGIEINWS